MRFGNVDNYVYNKMKNEQKIPHYQTNCKNNRGYGANPPQLGPRQEIYGYPPSNKQLQDV